MLMPSDAIPYSAALDAALPRVLSMLDREPISRTYGCADRVFWSWKFTDFPGARFQEIAYLLASLDSLTLPTEWAKAAIAYWQRLQHRDGSFDEAYPYERSLAATAFTGFYVGQAFLKLQVHYEPEVQAALIKTFAAAGDWLCRNDERHGVLSNHLAAAAAALQTIADITGNSKFTKRRDYFINRILQHQSSEGWYEEYGGADPGYQTHTTFYLAYVWTRTHDTALHDSLQRSVCYFWHFVHVNGSIGGEYASRNTRFYMPAGFEILAGSMPEAAAVAIFMRASIASQAVVGLEAMDAYNILPLFNNYCFAADFAKHLDQSQLPEIPFYTTGITQYPKSGHIVISTPAYQLIIATSKGGVCSAFAKQSGANLIDSGVALICDNGATVTSQGLHCSKVVRQTENSIEIEAKFVAVNQMLMSPYKFGALRGISLASALWPRFAYHAKRLLVHVLVRRKKETLARLIRHIIWSDQGITIEDKITLHGVPSIHEAWRGGRFSAVHMGSSRYFERHELADTLALTRLTLAQLQQLNEIGTLAFTRQWHTQK